MRLLILLSQKVASPNELARELDESLGTVSYHIRFLAELRWIELVRTEPRRGAVEHYYRAVERAFFSDEDWSQLPPVARRSISDAVLSAIWRDLAAAIEKDAFDARADRHLTRSPLVLDPQGWNELNALLLGVLDQAMAIEAQSAERLQEAGEDGTATKLVMMHFPSSRDGATVD